MVTIDLTLSIFLVDSPNINTYKLLSIFKSLDFSFQLQAKQLLEVFQTGKIILMSEARIYKICYIDGKMYVS